jgi:hypothetical protein
VTINNSYSNGIVFSDNTTFNTAQSLGPRNKIINGAMAITQYGTGAVTLNPSTSITSSGTSTVQWCDSLYITPIAGGTGMALVNDPSLANNKTCNSINLTSWVTNVGIIEAGIQGLVLFPNPATHKLNLAYDFGSNNSGFVTVTDITGKVVYTQDLGKNISGAQKIQLNINDLNSGAYFLQLQTADKREYSKFIIQ